MCGIKRFFLCVHANVCIRVKRAMDYGEKCKKGAKTPFLVYLASI